MVIKGRQCPQEAEERKMIYIPYHEEMKKINLLYTLYLYGIAEYNRETKCRDIINYKSAKSLKEKINSTYINANLSASTVQRLL